MDRRQQGAGGGRLDVHDDRVIEVDQVVGGVGAVRQAEVTAARTMIE